jgi:hypothetical protein
MTNPESLSAVPQQLEEPKMDIHKPKPIHSWRAFLLELGTIVLGVGIALAAEQTVEWLHWRGQVQQAKETIASEMVRNISFAIQRMRTVDCLTQRLTDLDSMLDAAARQGSLPPLADAGGVSQTPWSNGAWESVVASQAATHFAREQLAALSLVYRRVERIEAWNREESEAWAFIRSMEGPGRRLSATDETELRKAIRLAAYLNGVISVSAARMAQGAMDESLPFTSGERRQLAEAMKFQPPDYVCGKLVNQPPPGQQLVQNLGRANRAEMSQVEKRLSAMTAAAKP